MDLLLEQIKRLPKNIILLMVLQLMKDGVITFHEVAELQAEYMVQLKKGADDDFCALQSKVSWLWHDNKKNRDANLKEIMHFLKDKGKIMISDEEIDKKWRK